MQEEPLLIKRKNIVATLILNRPEKKNSLSPELVKSLLKALEELAAIDWINPIVSFGYRKYRNYY